MFLKNVKENIKIIGDLLGESYDVWRCDQMTKYNVLNEHSKSEKKLNQQQQLQQQHQWDQRQNKT